MGVTQVTYIEFRGSHDDLTSWKSLGDVLIIISLQ